MPFRSTMLPTALVLAFLMLAGCDTINSGLEIPPGEEFRLGENEHGRFSAAVENEGPVPVTLLAEALDGTRDELATLAPGASAKQQFEADTVAVFLNATDQAARLAVKITGDTGLSMEYEPGSS